MRYDLTKKDIDYDIKWLEKPNNTLHDYGDLVRYLLNEVEELKEKLTKVESEEPYPTDELYRLLDEMSIEEFKELVIKKLQ